MKTTKRHERNNDTIEKCMLKVSYFHNICKQNSYFLDKRCSKKISFQSYWFIQPD